MNLRALLVAAALSVSIFAGTASAQIALNIGAVTDYVSRGVSQTNEGGAVQGGIDMPIGPAYFGLWMSTVDYKDGTDAEFDMYLGVKPKWMGVSLDLALLNYTYLGGGNAGDKNYYEFKIAGSVPVGPATVGVATYYSPDFTGVGPHDAFYYELNVAMPVYRDFSVSGAIGKQHVQDKAGEYGTWNAGVTWAPVDWMSVDVRYHDTDEHGLGATYEARYVAGVKFTKTF